MKGRSNLHAVTRSRHGFRDLVRLVGLGLLIASVVRELRLPKQERTWHGVVFGRVPYDLRPPTIGRLKAVFWNPGTAQVVVPTAFGVGWTVNLGALSARVRGTSAP